METITYKIIRDGIYSHITLSSQAVDNIDVFGTLRKAKAALIKSHKDEISELKNAIDGVKEITAESLLQTTNEA